MSRGGRELDRRLGWVSLAQLGCGLAGLATALRRHHPYDVAFLKGAPDAVARDALWVGTALSAPGPMLVAQGVYTRRLLEGPDPRATAALALLGTAMVGGHLVERHDRHRLTPAGWDPWETPLIVVALGLSAAMAVLGWAARRR